MKSDRAMRAATTAILLVSFLSVAASAPNWMTKAMDDYSYKNCNYLDKSNMVSDLNNCLVSGPKTKVKRSLFPASFGKYSPEYPGKDGKSKDSDDTEWPKSLVAEMDKLYQCMDGLVKTKCFTEKERQFFDIQRKFVGVIRDVANASAADVAAALKNSSCKSKNNGDANTQCYSTIHVKYKWRFWPLNWDDGQMCAYVTEMRDCEVKAYAKCPVEVYNFVVKTWNEPMMKTTPCQVKPPPAAEAPAKKHNIPVMARSGIDIDQYMGQKNGHNIEFGQSHDSRRGSGTENRRHHRPHERQQQQHHRSRESRRQQDERDEERDRDRDSVRESQSRDRDQRREQRDRDNDEREDKDEQDDRRHRAREHQHRSNGRRNVDRDDDEEDIDRQDDRQNRRHSQREQRRRTDDRRRNRDSDDEDEEDDRRERRGRVADARERRREREEQRRRDEDERENEEREDEDERANEEREDKLRMREEERRREDDERRRQQSQRKDEKRRRESQRTAEVRRDRNRNADDHQDEDDEDDGGHGGRSRDDGHEADTDRRDSGHDGVNCNFNSCFQQINWPIGDTRPLKRIQTLCRSYDQQISCLESKATECKANGAAGGKWRFDGWLGKMKQIHAKLCLTTANRTLQTSVNVCFDGKQVVECIIAKLETAKE